MYTTDGDSLSTEQADTFAAGMNYCLHAIFNLLADMFKLVQAGEWVCMDTFAVLDRACFCVIFWFLDVCLV